MRFSLNPFLVSVYVQGATMKNHDVDDSNAANRGEPEFLIFSILRLLRWEISVVVFSRLLPLCITKLCYNNLFSCNSNSKL